MSCFLSHQGAIAGPSFSVIIFQKSTNGIADRYCISMLVLPKGFE